jgi:hypothetical protein
VWELIWLMLIMKIPILYLCWVVWWAIKAEPRPEEGAAITAALPSAPPEPGWGWHVRRRRPPRPRPGRPHGGPTRVYARTARTTLAGSRR